MKRNNRFSKITATFFLAIFVPTILPFNLLYASNNGPNAPEAAGFESINATDMVNLATGDMSYVLPVMDIGGFPVTMSYHGGIPLDLESTWTGLGWNINTGAINRSLNATPDDWNGGNSTDFIRYQDSEEFYNIDVGVGLGKYCEVGVGMAWGSNKSMSGSVFANAGYKGMSVGGRIDTNGNYSLGVGGGTNDSSGGASFGGGLSMSGNVNSGEKTYGVGVGVRADNGLTVGMGADLNGGGVSGSIGYSNTTGNGAGTKGQSGAVGMSVANFSQGDWDIKSKGFYIPAQIYFISLGFGKRKVTSNLTKGVNKKGYGILYSGNTGAVELDQSVNDAAFNDYQNKYRYIDTYEQALPVTEEEFVGDYESEREKINFTGPGYDSYDVNATGLSGTMKPKILQNSTLYGLGYAGVRSNSNDKMRIYNHNGNTTNKTFGTNNLSNIEFYFDGQFTQNVSNTPLNPVINNSGSTNLVNTLSPRAAADDNGNMRLKQANFVEVYTNNQIRNNQAPGLLAPEGLPNNLRNTAEFKPDGIGGYKITSPDGKTYHYSLPVYHFEQVERNVLKDNTEDHVSEKRQYTPYATHWLLTAITGPDFFDANNNNMADEADYGYWIRLDHGKWSDGYVWRTPTNKAIKEYYSDIDGQIGTKDFGHYQFGRKQLYYLDKIVSATHTAFFVKNLRYDSAGSDLTYSYNKGNMDNDGTGGNTTIYPNENFTYRRQLQLMLEKIILVKNADAATIKKFTTSPNELLLNEYNLGNYGNSYNIGFNSNGGFANEYGNPTININREGYVYDTKDFEGFDYNKAVKVVQLEYNYRLATGSPGTISCNKNPNLGKLTLKKVRFLGRGNFDYMPPYEFEYKGEYGTTGHISYPANAINQKTSIFGTTTISYEDNRKKDEWGFLKSDPAAWTLTKIKTPTGAALSFEHEEDDYAIEAFSRRYWTNKLQFSFSNRNNGTFDITIRKNSEETLNQGFSFLDYFSTTEPFYIDLWLCVIDRDFGVSTDREKVSINQQAITPISVTNDEVVIRLNEQNYIQELDDSGDLFDHTFRLTSGNGSEHPPQISGYRNSCPDDGDGFDLIYKIIASKVPLDKTGGGLRVRSISLIDENYNNYKTNYYYNVPGTGKTKGSSTYKSSGITSFSPVNGVKFVPYQSELPGPGVMYEYVTMVPQGQSTAVLGETRYRFTVLRPVFDIFNPNISMADDDGNKIFEAVVTNHTGGGNGYHDANKKIKAKSINVGVNTSLIGQLRSIEEFNTAGQLMSKMEKKYMSGQALKTSGIKRGAMKESFQSMKSVYETNSNDENPALRNRLLSISTKEDFTSALVSTVYTNMHGKSTENYLDSDENTGSFNTVEKKMANGKMMRIQRVPAYTKYPEMGMKTDTDMNKRHMLTQEAMTITSVNDNGAWKTIDANITTWNKNWSYRNNNGTQTVPTTEKEKIYRKHKNFIWKENLSFGYYTTNLTAANSQFNWSTGIPSSNNWQKASEITRYSRYSMPLETKDINGNFASTRLADNSKKVLVSGNARLTEMYYCGAEHIDPSNTTLFDGEVGGTEFRSNKIAHTGKFSLVAKSPQQNLFTITGVSGTTGYYSNPDTYTQAFRPGKYKASVWSNKDNNPSLSTQLHVNGQIYTPVDVVDAGCWQQLNFYFDILPSRSNTIFIRCTDARGETYYDDFRLHPVSSSINSYVYDQNTDELLYILDANNMGTAFRYDNAGRVIATYTETFNDQSFIGGFKITGRNKQVYKNTAGAYIPAQASINNCLNNNPVITTSVGTNAPGTYLSNFITNVSGGSGNFTYQYSWLKDPVLQTYTEFTPGTETQLIPYAAEFCSDNNSYDKIWKLRVKVTDNDTGEQIDESYTYEHRGCEFTHNGNWSDIQVSRLENYCSPDAETFRIHLKNPAQPGDFKYEYAYYSLNDPSQDPSALTYFDVTSEGGRFCPVYKMVADASSASGYRKIAKVVFRITDLNTNQVNTYNYITFFGGETAVGQQLEQTTNQAGEERYMKEGNLIYKDSDGKISRVVDIYNIVK